MNERYWHVRTLQAVVGLWNWFMLIARPAFATFRRIYELTSREKVIVFATAEAKHELRTIIVLVLLLFVSISRPSAEVILCSSASMIRETLPYSKNTMFHKTQNTLIRNFHSVLWSENSLPQTKLKTITIQR